MKPLAVLVLLFGSVLAACQQPPAERPVAAPAAQPATREDIARLLEAMRVKKQMAEMQRTMVEQYKPMVEKMTAEQSKNMTPQQRVKLQEIVAEMLSDSFNAYPAEQGIADVIPIYQRYLDKADVEAMTAFYSSPSGQKYLDIQPKIIRDFMSVIMPKIQDRIQASVNRMQERIRDLVAEGQDEPAHEHDSKPSTPAPKRK